MSDAVLIMIRRGCIFCPSRRPSGEILGVFSVRDAHLPREIGAAVSMAEFNEQSDDARG